MSSSKFQETIYGRISAEWDLKKIVEYAEVVTDYVANGSFASIKENVQYPAFAPIICNITNYGI